MKLRLWPLLLLSLLGCTSVRTVAFTQRVLVRVTPLQNSDRVYYTLTSTDGYMCITTRTDIRVGELVECDWNR